MNLSRILLVVALMPTALFARDGEWSLGPERWLQPLGELGAWALGGLVLLALYVSVRTRARYRAVAVFDEAARERVRAAVASAEGRTTGEIVPVLLERSDPHPAGEWRAALGFLLLGSALLARQLPWHIPLALVGCQLALGAVGFWLARALPHAKRLFISEARATATAEEQAFIEYQRHGLASTEAATGVLLFVSLFERRVVVLADSAIAERVDPGVWAEIDDIVLDGVTRGALADGLVVAIERSGDLLAEHFPWNDGDRNELPDHLIVRRE